MSTIFYTGIAKETNQKNLSILCSVL